MPSTRRQKKKNQEIPEADIMGLPQETRTVKRMKLEPHLKKPTNKKRNLPEILTGNGWFVEYCYLADTKDYS